jgi:hypothetical protein
MKYDVLNVSYVIIAFQDLQVVSLFHLIPWYFITYSETVKLGGIVLSILKFTSESANSSRLKP